MYAMANEFCAFFNVIEFKMNKEKKTIYLVKKIRYSGRMQNTTCKERERELKEIERKNKFQKNVVS